MQPTWHARTVAKDLGQLTVYVRNHQFDVGQPLHFDYEYNAISALEYVVGALSADVVGSLIGAARRRRVHLENIEAAASCELRNALTYLGVVGEAGDPGLERVKITTYVKTATSEQDMHLLWEEALTRSPLVQTFRSAVILDLELKLV